MSNYIFILKNIINMELIVKYVYSGLNTIYSYYKPVTYGNFDDLLIKDLKTAYKHLAEKHNDLLDGFIPLNKPYVDLLNKSHDLYINKGVFILILKTHVLIHQYNNHEIIKLDNRRKGSAQKILENVIESYINMLMKLPSTNTRAISTLISTHLSMLNFMESADQIKSKAIINYLNSMHVVIDYLLDEILLKK